MTDWGTRTREIAVEVGIDADLFYRQIKQESGFNPDAHNNTSGADGIAQIVARFHPGVNTRDPETSLQYAARLMKSHLEAYSGDWALALSCYNAGPGNTAKGLRGELPGWPFAETVSYVANILDIPRFSAIRRLTGQKINDGGTVPDLTLSEVLTRMRSMAGAPYVFGGLAPLNPDCSAAVSYAYRGKVRRFTDWIYDDTERVDGKDVAPGDIVLYEYADYSQPGVRFPHVAIYLSDTRVIDARYGHTLGERDQLPRSKATRYYRRVPGIVVDTIPGQPAPPVHPDQPKISLEDAAKYVDQAITTLYHLRSLLP